MVPKAERILHVVCVYYLYPGSFYSLASCTPLETVHIVELLSHPPKMRNSEHQGVSMLSARCFAYCAWQEYVSKSILRIACDLFLLCLLKNYTACMDLYSNLQIYRI
jgi:hypothetical protein